MFKEYIRNIIIIIVTIAIIFLLTTPIFDELPISMVNISFTFETLAIAVMVILLYALKNSSTMNLIYITKKVTVSYLFSFLVNIFSTISIFLTLLATNQLELVPALLIVMGEIIIVVTYLIAGGYLADISFSLYATKIKELLAFLTIMLIVTNNAPFEGMGWPVSTFVMFGYILYLVNISYNNLSVIKEKV